MLSQGHYVWKQQDNREESQHTISLLNAVFLRASKFSKKVFGSEQVNHFKKSRKNDFTIVI